MSLFVGIDVSKKTLDIAIAGTSCYTQVANDATGFAHLDAWLQDQGEISQIALEASGRYGEALAVDLVTRGYAVSYLNPAQISAFSKLMLRFNKTDKQDALLIAQFCQLHRPDLWQAPTALQQRLKLGSRRIHALEKMRQQERNRLESLGDDPLVRESIQAVTACLDEQIRRLKQDLTDLIAGNTCLQQRHRLLTSIKGIGDKTATLLLSEIEIDRFDTAAQLAAYLGITPQDFQSGTSVKRRSRISKQGNQRLRAALYMPAVSAKRWNPACRRLAQRLETRNKHPKLIVIAVMRKLIHQVFGVLKSAQPFDPLFENLP